MLESNQIIKIGAVSFKESVQQILPLSCKIEKQIENRLYWHLYSRRYTQQKWNDIMNHIKQIEVEEMQLADNQYQHIIKDIAPISFPNLISLSLISNKINSIEHLCTVQMPNLLYLHLCRNDIVKIAALRKAYWPNLLRIIMNDNPIIDCPQILNQCFFPKLQLLIMEGWKDSLVFTQNLSFLLKLQTNTFKYLNINSQQRIKQSKIQKQLQNRFKILKINTDQ